MRYIIFSIARVAMRSAIFAFYIEEYKKVDYTIYHIVAIDR